MASTVEARERGGSQADILRETQLIQATSELESARRIPIIRDTVSIQTILKSNARVHKWLDRCFLGAGRLSQRLGGVGKLSSVIRGLSNLVRGM